MSQTTYQSAERNSYQVPEHPLWFSHRFTSHRLFKKHEQVLIWKNYIIVMKTYDQILEIASGMIWRAYTEMYIAKIVTGKTGRVEWIYLAFPMTSSCMWRIHYHFSLINSVKLFPGFLNFFIFIFISFPFSFNIPGVFDNSFNFSMISVPSTESSFVAGSVFVEDAKDAPGTDWKVVQEVVVHEMGGKEMTAQLVYINSFE